MIMRWHAQYLLCGLLEIGEKNLLEIKNVVTTFIKQYVTYTLFSLSACK